MLSVSQLNQMMKTLNTQNNATPNRDGNCATCGTPMTKGKDLGQELGPNTENLPEKANMNVPEAPGGTPISQGGSLDDANAKMPVQPGGITCPGCGGSL